MHIHETREIALTGKHTLSPDEQFNIETYGGTVTRRVEQITFRATVTATGDPHTAWIKYSATCHNVTKKGQGAEFQDVNFFPRFPTDVDRLMWDTIVGAIRRAVVAHHEAFVADLARAEVN